MSKDKSTQIFKSFKEMKSALEGESDYIFFKRFNGQITGQSNLNVGGFLKMLKPNLRNLFVLTCLQEAGHSIVDGEIVITEPRKASEFFNWLEAREEHNQSTEAEAVARPLELAEEISEEISEEQWNKELTAVAALEEKKSSKKTK